jgi:hypothetical protein
MSSDPGGNRTPRAPWDGFNSLTIVHRRRLGERGTCVLIGTGTSGQGGVDVECFRVTNSPDPDWKQPERRLH